VGEWQLEHAVSFVDECWHSNMVVAESISVASKSYQGRGAVCCAGIHELSQHPYEYEYGYGNISNMITNVQQRRRFGHPLLWPEPEIADRTKVTANPPSEA